MKCADRCFAAGFLCLLTALGAGAAQAQLRVGADVGFIGFSGATANIVSKDSATLRPADGVRLNVRAALGFGGNWEAALSIHSATSGLRAQMGSFAIVDGGALNHILAAPAIGRRLGGAAGSAQWWLEAGPTFTLWSIPGEGFRPRFGAASAVSLRQRLSSRLSASTRARAGVGFSPFDADELPAEVKRVAVWEFGLSFGLEFTL